MQLNIIQFIKNFFYNIKDLILVYFTHFPYYIYQIGSNNSNFAICGVGLGLIQAQRLFWISNTLIVTSFYFKNHINLYVYYFCVFISILLISRSLQQTLELLKLINVQNCRSTP
jgi:hypothetical protein